VTQLNIVDKSHANKSIRGFVSGVCNLLSTLHHMASPVLTYKHVVFDHSSIPIITIREISNQDLVLI